MNRPIVKGAVDQTVYLSIADSASTTGGKKTGIVYNAAGLTAYYTRARAAATAITLATQTVTGAHSDGGFIEVSSTNAPGLYRLDLPDAAVASGVDEVIVTLKGASGMVQADLRIPLVDGDVTLNLPSVNVGSVSGDSTAADNLESDYDGTGYAKTASSIRSVTDLSLRRNTAQAGAAGTITLDASASATDDFYNDAWIAIVGGTGVGQVRMIADYAGSTQVATITPNWSINPNNTSVFTIFPAARMDLAMLQGGLQSVTDLKDFADAGYDLATHKVNGVILVDTVTEVDGDTPQTGDSFAIVNSGTFGNAAIKTLEEAIAGYLDTEVAAIKAKTDALPSDPADESLIEAAITAAQTAILAKVLKYFQLTLRKDGGIATDNAAEVTAINADGGSGGGTFANTTDALEAVRDRGDLAWGGAGSETTLDSGTAQAGAASTITLRSGASAVNDYYKYAIIALTGGTGAGQSAIISGYVGSTKVATINGAWGTNPDNTSEYKIFPFGAVPGATAPTAGQVAAAVWDEARSDHDASGSTGQGLNDVRAFVRNKKIVDHGNNSAEVYKDDGSTLRFTLTPTKNESTNKTTVTPT